jgi:hypothetical protein
MSSPSALAPDRHDSHSVGFNLGVIAVVLAMGGLGLAYAIQALGHPAAATGATETVRRTLGGATLDIPAAWLREDATSSEGFAKQVELTVTLNLGPEAAPRRIDVTLLPRSRARPSASMLDGVYLHQFLPEQLSGPPGLIGKPLRAQDGFSGETVWYDALSSSPLVAKCLAPVSVDSASRCLRTIYLGPGIAAVYAFDADVLGNWKKFDAEMHPLLVRIGAL